MKEERGNPRGIEAGEAVIWNDPACNGLELICMERGKVAAYRETEDRGETSNPVIHLLGRLPSPLNKSAGAISFAGNIGSSLFRLEAKSNGSAGTVTTWSRAMVDTASRNGAGLDTSPISP